MAEKPYKKTEKWWLILTVLFYALYNLPGIPSYGEPIAALWHGSLTIIPLWVIIYVGLFKVHGQRRLKETHFPNIVNKADSTEKGGA